METTAQTIIVRTQKSMGMAYVLLLFLGGLGLHRFYLDRPGSGGAMLALGLIEMATVWLLVGFVFLVPLWIWQFVDLFLLPGMVREANQPA